MRKELLYKLDDLLETCKGCHRKSGFNNTVSPEVVCKGCKTYKGISEIGNQLLSIKKERKPMAQAAVLDRETYQQYKFKGLTDAEISRQHGIKQPTLAYYKKKWATEATEPTAVEIKPSESKSTQEDKIAEYERIIAMQNKTIAEQIENQSKLNKIIDDYENINAACEDVENELASLRDENATLVKQGHHDSYIISNQKYQLEKWAMQVEALEEENKALKYFARKYLG
jgi:hypothetical protein